MRKLFSLLTALLFVGSVWGADVYELTTSITNGEYVIGAIQGTAGANNTIKAIQSTVTSGWGKYRAITPSNGKITDPNSDVVWTLTKIGDNSFSLKNGTNYYKITESTGSGSVSLDTESSTIYFVAIGNNTNAFELSGVSTFTVSTGNQLACNQGNSYGYRQYAQRTHGTGDSEISTQIRFYKKSGPTVSSISVKTAPTKVAYKENEYFNPTGLVITATYSNSTSADIAYAGNESDFTFSPSLTTALTTSNTSVTITYGEQSTTQPISVTGCTSSITISKGTPENGTFDITGTGDVCIDGGNASVTISNIEPTDGYRFKEITSSNGGTIDNSAKTVTDISASTTINVVFELIPEVHAEANDPDFGSVEVNGTTITATPAKCYRVKSGNGGYSVIEGEAIVSHTGTSNTLTVDPVNECTIQVIFEKNVNIYKDNIQGTETFDDCSTKAPKLEDKTIAKTGSCTQQHYHFVGWVSEANISNITPQTVKAAGSNITVNGTTYYAVWAKYASGDIYTISIDGAGLQAAVANKDTYSSVNFVVGGYTFNASQAMKCTTKAISGWFQLKKNNDAISIPELPGRITNISSTAIRTTSGGNVSTGVCFNSSKTTSNPIASEDLSNATSFSLDIDSEAKEGYLLFGAATCINQLSVTYSTVQYTDSIALCCKNSITVDSEIANGSVEADKEEACAGETVTLTVTPEEGFVATNVAYNGTQIIPVENVYSFEMPEQAVTITATFAKSSTAVDNIETSAKAVKVLKNGLLLIEKNGKTYNAQGQLVK